MQLPYWKTAGSGFLECCGRSSRVRSDFTGPQSYDPKAERDALDQAVQKKATGILLTVTDPALLKDSIDKAMAAGIPVITIDSDAPSSKRLFFIGTNNYQAGFTGGQRLAQELKGKGNVVVFTMPDQPNLQDRLRGYKDALAKYARDQDHARRRYSGRSTHCLRHHHADRGQRARQGRWFRLPGSAVRQGSRRRSQQLSRTGKVVIAMDTDQETLDWIQKGVIAATIAQKPYTMAFVGMQMLDNLYHHKPPSLDTDWSKDAYAPIPMFVDTGSDLIDKANVQSFIEAGKNLSLQIEFTVPLDGALMREAVALHYCPDCCSAAAASALHRQPDADYKARREALAKKVGEIVVLLARWSLSNAVYSFRQDDDFYYLSGWTEPGAALLIAPALEAGDKNPARALHRNSFSASAQCSRWRDLPGPKLGADESAKLRRSLASTVSEEMAKLPQELSKLIGSRSARGLHRYCLGPGETSASRGASGIS